jgi:hypothetical protein
MSNPEPTKKVYAGWVRLATETYEDDGDILFVVPTDDLDLCDYEDEDTLAYKIEEDILAHGRYLSVQYFVSDTEQSFDELQVAWLNRLEGIGDADYYVHWSECTGYLWTDEEINVGGHDLLAELKGYDGKYLYLEIQYSKEARQ